MRLSAAGLTAVGNSRSLYLVPDREVPRASYVPVARALHLVDLENLMCGPCQPVGVLRNAVALYRELAPVHREDHVIIAVNPALALEAGLAWPAAQLRIGRGPHGADHELLAAIDDRAWVAARFDRIIVGSGDGIFSAALKDLRQLGIATGVVAPGSSLSRDLRRSATFVRLFPCLATEQIVA